MLSPVIGHDSNSVQLWLLFELRLPYVWELLSVDNNQSNSLLKGVALLGMWALVSACLAGPLDLYRPFMHGLVFSDQLTPVLEQPHSPFQAIRPSSSNSSVNLLYSVLAILFSNLPGSCLALHHSPTVWHFTILQHGNPLQHCSVFTSAAFFLGRQLSSNVGPNRIPVFPEQFLH